MGSVRGTDGWGGGGGRGGGGAARQRAVLGDAKVGDLVAAVLAVLAWLVVALVEGGLGAAPDVLTDAAVDLVFRTVATRHINVLHSSTRAGGLLLKERAHDYNGGTASPRHEAAGKTPIILSRQARWLLVSAAKQGGINGFS